MAQSSYILMQSAVQCMLWISEYNQDFYTQELFKTIANAKIFLIIGDSPFESKVNHILEKSELIVVRLDSLGLFHIYCPSLDHSEGLWLEKGLHKNQVQFLSLNKHCPPEKTMKGNVVKKLMHMQKQDGISVRSAAKWQL